MGASQSRTDTEDKIFQNQVPISFSQDVVNHLSDNLESSETSSQRQSLIDAHIRSRIQSELEHLRKEEENVQQEVERALEKENLDRERTMTGQTSAEDENVSGNVKTSSALLGDLEELRNKINKYHSKREVSEYPEVKAAASAVTHCYQRNKTTTLDCWREVQDFKESVGKLEQQYLESL